jgi:RND family efflux transporter MFP subunit
MPSPTAAPSLPTPESFVGVILSHLSADVAPRFEGRLRDVRVRLGDRVGVGQVLAELDAPSLRFELRAAEAALAVAGVDEVRTKVELAEAQERLGQRQSLASESLVTGEELSASRYQERLAATKLESSRAQAAERLAQVERLRKDNADAQIVAPFDGIIAARYADPGGTVRPATPVVRLVSTRDLFVRFAVPEGRAGAVAVGGAVRVRTGEGRPGLEGSVERVAPEIDAASRMVFVEARLASPEAEAPLLVGEMARVSMAATP